MNVASLLDGLDDRGCRELADALAYRVAQKPGKGDLGRDEHALWDALNHALGILPNHRQPIKAFVERYGKAKFRGRIAEMDSFIAQSCEAGMRLPVRDSVRASVLRALVAYLRNADIACTPTTILNSFVMMGDAIDAHFPGYAAAKLLHRVAVIAHA